MDVLEAEMDDSKAVAVGSTSVAIQLRDLKDYLTLGDVLFKSGYFTDVKSAAQAVAKMIAGAEMGFGPMASLNGVYIQGGKPSFMANMIASAVKRNGYDYTIDILDETKCKLTFYGRGGKLLGVSEFSMDDAKRAELTTGKNAHSWRHFPRNMLFSRAISNGARWYTPDIFGGTTPYTPDELDMVIDGETGVATVQSTVTGSPNGSRPQQPEPTTPKPEPTTPATAPVVTTPTMPAPVTAPAPQTVERTPEMDAELEKFFGKEEPTKAQPAPATEPVQVKIVKIWDGEKWQEKRADEQIKASSGNWFSIKFVGKDKAFGHQKHLFGEPPNNQGHLGKHFGRNNFVDAKSSMTYDQFAALVGYAWYKQGDKEHGYLDPRFYADKIEEELKAHPPVDVSAPSIQEMETRATKLGMDLVTLMQVAYGTADKPISYTELNDAQRSEVWNVMGLVENGTVDAGDFDKQVTMLMVDK